MPLNMLKMKIEKASELGKKAFEAGKVAVPALDRDFCLLLKTVKMNHVKLLDAWIKAWHTANLAASTVLPVEKKPGLSHFVNNTQAKIIFDLCKGKEEGKFFIEKMRELAIMIDTMPKTYEQDGKGDQAVAYLHYFTPGFDWYITERDMEEAQLQAFGLACIHEMELGYISIQDILANGAELDLYWTPKILKEIKEGK